MSIEQLKDLAKRISKEVWGTELDVDIVKNNRLSKSYGRFVYKYKRDSKGKIVEVIPDRIEFNMKHVSELPGFKIVEVVKHELCHWYCMKKGISYGDGSNGFEREFKRIKYIDIRYRDILK